MPRIDPIQLLNCLSVLLSPNGGIKSRNEVERLAGLMTKFSKKLVSKCIYIQILKCTETYLLGLFMGSGGWLLVHMWLTESIVAKNWPLVKELLELLLLCPVDIERLKTNNCPKLVKELSKDGNHFAIRALASKLVEQWLKTVKGEHVEPVQEDDIAQIIINAEIKSEETKGDENLGNVKVDIEVDKPVENDSKSLIVKENESQSAENLKENKTEEDQETLPILKITLKDGKQVISQVEEIDSKDESDSEKSKTKTKSKDKSSDRRSSSSGSKSSSSKHSSKTSSSSEKYKSSHKSSNSVSSHSSRHRSKDDKTKDKERHSHNSKSKNDTIRKSGDKSSSSSNKYKDDRSIKSDKERHKDKEKNHDKDKSYEKTKSSKDIQKSSDDKSDDKIQTPPSIQKLGKIPKLSDVKKDKPSISIEVRKPDEPKPKTVKTFHSKFRKHGLEEEIKPPPSRAALLNKKVPPALPLPPTVSIPKRASPVHNETPPEKKPKIVEPVEKPGSIKLIPPKPKRAIFKHIVASYFGSLLMNFFCGKSKMHNLLGSRTFLLLVNFSQIKAEFFR